MTQFLHGFLWLEMEVDYPVAITYNETSMSKEFLIPLVIVALSFVLVVSTLGSPGLTWDEANFIVSIEWHLKWFRLLAENIKEGKLSPALSGSAITYHWRSTSEHPPLAKLLSGISISLFRGLFDLVFAARVSTAIIFPLLILLVYKFTFEAYGQHAACFSALSLLIMPRILGHAHLASLDTCMAFTWLLTVFSFVKGIHDRRWSIITGISYGFALATKLNSLFLPIPLLLWGHLYHRKKYYHNLIAMLSISPAIFFLIWPWLWPEPIARTINYLRIHRQRILIPVYYLGTAYKDINAPWHYPIVLTAITLPPAVLVLAISELVVIVRKRLRDPIGALILLNIIVCIGIMTLPQVNKYDGVRLFLPAFPFIACLSGIGLSRALKKIRLFNKKHLMLGSGILLLALSALPLVRIRPYYLSYYNIFVGGVKGAKQCGFETTYWGDTCTQSILEYLNKNARENAVVVFYPAGSNVVPLYKFTGRLRKDINQGKLEEWETLDYLVLNCREGFFDEKLWQIHSEEKWEHATTFQDVLLTAVYKIN